MFTFCEVSVKYLNSSSIYILLPFFGFFVRIMLRCSPNFFCRRNFFSAISQFCSSPPSSLLISHAILLVFKYTGGRKLFSYSLHVFEIENDLFRVFCQGDKLLYEDFRTCIEISISQILVSKGHNTKSGVGLVLLMMSRRLIATFIHTYVLNRPCKVPEVLVL